MRRLFDEELADLDSSFTEMGMLVSQTIQKAVQSFVDHDREGARQILENDHQINEREAAIEKKTFEMIALYQPVTTDLREIVTILKAVSVLERMGDQARNIANSTIRVKGTKHIASIEQELGVIGEMVANMVSQVMEYYVKNDALGAESIAEANHKLSQSAAKVRTDSVNGMKENADLVDSAADYLVIAGYLKRIGDYTTDIAEWIVYKRTGKIIELNPGYNFFI
ncbi:MULTISPECIES: phosphate signaling complex protein PhoU [Leuconostoc]|uniref:Phosphate-specific transport system accessory protein PhoU n=3 Tax=Leuconostoc TaxID=1243 RepID=A0A1X0VF20_LEUPS|nr:MULTISPECIES: phosphate signaling complex protein PhoU [Leuconostoc]KDA48512.1 Phosphate transport system regulatory protein PhoU [Leuconostoc pseudomesenteroides 1159]KDA50569.1 Phosphate transport system regulatory protein PhoU [Leuconostoc pseudomesenteroides PS12]CCJ66591.1 Phosphate transport system regulatory protein PhoU [Leuconostoc pseudomesenteroides 4882]MBK0039720.1 phosphate signaling complex protein PhoU [Leuconostoc sp. S51]MBK0050679.1 phosphate signaling complex protein Pho